MKGQFTKGEIQTVKKPMTCNISNNQININFKKTLLFYQTNKRKVDGSRAGEDGGYSHILLVGV